jgi:hypothetical protein
LNNFRMWSYALIALGLINWDYQRANSNIVGNSLLIVIPGLVLLSLTFIKSGRAILAKSFSKYFWAVVGIAAIVFAFMNK